MRLVLFFSLVLVLVARRSFAADFPAPNQLGGRAELPDPLVMFNDDKVTTKKQWLEKRRPELKELFQHYMYGRLPEPREVEGTVVHEDKRAFGGKATLQEIAVRVGPKDWPAIHVLVVFPNKK